MDNEEKCPTYARGDEHCWNWLMHNDARDNAQQGYAMQIKGTAFLSPLNTDVRLWAVHAFQAREARESVKSHPSWLSVRECSKSTQFYYLGINCGLYKIKFVYVRWPVCPLTDLRSRHHEKWTRLCHPQVEANVTSSLPYWMTKT